MKRLRVIGLLLLVAVAVAAQPRLRQPELYFGVQAGVNAAAMDFYPAVPLMTPITQAVTLSPLGGFVFRYSGQKCCAVQVELNYMQRGWAEKGTETSSGTAVAYVRRLHYIEMPVLMHIYFGKKVARGFINLGPQIGYCIADDKGTGTRQTVREQQYAAIDNRFDWGVTGGLGMSFRTMNAGSYMVEARFGYSFGTIFSSDLTDYFQSSRPMNLSIHVGWLWEFKKK